MNSTEELGVRTIWFNPSLALYQLSDFTQTFEGSVKKLCDNSIDIMELQVLRVSIKTREF